MLSVHVMFYYNPDSKVSTATTLIKAPCPVKMTYFVKVTVCDKYLLYQLKSSQLTPSSWYSLSVLPFLYSLVSSSFFHELAAGRG